MEIATSNTKDSLRAHSLLGHLDSLKPILQLDFNYVKLVYDRLTKSKPDHVLLNYYDVPAADVSKIFPNQSLIISWLINVFQFHKPHIGQSIMVLDILTTMTILTTGSISEKCKLLFSMYNINGTGLMDESEHVNFILRTSNCMKKLKLMQTLDMTAPEAKYIALEARVIYENNQITFIPGLQVTDFIRWVQTSKETQTLFRFVKVVNRLVDSLTALEHRTNAILNIMEIKKEYKLNASPVPPLDIFQETCKKNDLPVYVVYRCSNSASFTVPLYDLTIREIFIKYDKIVPLSSSSLYEIPRSILKRNTEVYRANQNPQLHCCDKTFLLTSYLRIPVHHPSQRSQHQIPYHRVDITGLEPGTSYFVTIYTPDTQFRTVKITTNKTIGMNKVASGLNKTGFLQAEDIEATAEDNLSSESDEEASWEDSNTPSVHDHSHSSVPRSTLLILPACLSVKEAESLCAQLQDKEHREAERTIVFTGTVCPVDEALRNSLQLVGDTQSSNEFHQRVAGSVSTMAATQMAHTWAGYVATLLGIAQCAAPNEYMRELVVSAEKAQVLVYNGCGPWSNIEAQRYIQAKFGLQSYTAIQEKLEYVYNLYMASIVPMKYCIQADSTQVYFVQRSSVSPILAPAMGAASNSTITVSALTELLFTRLRSNDHLANAPQHIVVVVRSPEDLFGEAEELQQSDGTTPPSGASNLTVAAGSQLLQKPLSNPSLPADSSVIPKLTGRHELIHGEFSSRPTGIPPQQDSSFLGLLPEEAEDHTDGQPSGSSEQYDSTLSMFLRVAAKWLQGGIQSTGDYQIDWTTTANANTRKLTIVSCNWDNGENFQISFKNSKTTAEISQDRVFIDHENLLQTKSYNGTGTVSGSRTEEASIIANKDDKRSMGKSAVSSYSSAASLASAEEETGRSGASAPNSASAQFLNTPALSTPATLSAYEKSEAFTQSLTATELILQRVTASLPKQAQFILKDSTPLRCFQTFTADDDAVNAKNLIEKSSIIPVCDYNKERFWWRKEAEIAVNIPIESVAIASGPHIIRVSGNAVVVSVDIVGLGRVHCSIYEVPAFMQYSDVVSVVATEDRKKLRCLGTKSQYSAGIGERRMVFHFDQLMHFCCYCVVVDPFTDHIPAVALLRTLGLPSSTVDSILLCPTSAEDYRAPSQRVNRLMHFAAMSRSPISAAFCLDYNAAVLRNYTGEEQKHKADLHYLRQQGNFKTPKANSQHNFQHALPFLIHNSCYQNNRNISTEQNSSVFVSIHGYYCYISAQNEEPSSLRKIIHAIRSLQHNSTVRFVILLVNQPLIRYLRLRDDGHFVCDGPMMHHKLLCCLLFIALLSWKAQDDGNDCKIICTAPVSEPKCILIRYAQHIADTVHPQARYDDLSVATHRNIHSPKGSVATGMHLGGDFLEMPSLVLEPSTEELSSSPRLEQHKEKPFHNLESIYESIADCGVNDLQLQHQLSAVFAGSLLGLSHRVEPSMIIRDLIADKGGFLTLEHLILPVQYHSVEGEEVDESLTLPDGKCLIEDIIEYEVLQEYTAEETGVYKLEPRLDLYRETLRAEEKIQPVVYRLEFLVHLLQPREQALQNADGENKALLGNVYSNHNSNTSAYSELVSINAQHRVYLRPLLSEFDLVDMLLGPVIGRTTADTAIVLFEFNMNLQQLSCVLQPLGAQDENDFVYKAIENIKGFELIELQFTELLPGTYYEIFLPELFGSTVIGKFKTIQPYLAFAQIAFTSANTIKRHPINNRIVSQLMHQQTPNLLEIRLINEIIFEEERMKQQNESNNSRIINAGGYDNTWAKLGDHLNAPGVHTAAVFHLGGVAVLSEYWSSIVDAMIAQTRRLEIPLRDASTVGQWYFKQVEQIVKDSFRLFWNTPVVKEVFSHTSNIPLYQAQYLLPLSVLEDKLQANRIVESDVDNMLLQLVRRIFESHLHAYMARLYNWETGASSHFIQWRSNSLVVVGIDSVSGRRKLKKKSEGEEDEDETAAVSGKLGKDTPKGTEKVDPKDPYSLGFIDRGQWKHIRSLVQDRTVTHIVILTERPIIPLTYLPTAFPVPETIAKGEVLEWQPTQQDLEIFLKFWFDWLSMFQTSEVSSCRSVLLVSSSKMPYSTLIQDLRTGQKIHQLCVGEYDSSTSLRDLPFRPADICMSGKLGTMRYVHQFDGQDYYLAQSIGIEKNNNFIERGAEKLASPTAAADSDKTRSAELILLKSSGYATLRLWFDSWKALGIWSQESPEAGVRLMKQTDATLLIGPILSVPQLHSPPTTEATADSNMLVNDQSYFTVAMLIEVDRPTSIVLQARSVFTEHNLQLDLLDLQPRRPYVFNIGPLRPEDRYNIRLTSGLKPSPHNFFVIDTYMHETETTILALNCDPLQGEPSGSQIIIEASKRCSVPFSGITAALHTNFQPSFDHICNEFRYSNSILDGLKEAKQTGTLSVQFRIELESIIEVFRDQYRTVLSKPSYAELLRKGYNLMMRNSAPGFADDPDMDQTSELYEISRLLALIIARLNQEYFDQWMLPESNVFKSVKIHKTTATATDAPQSEPAEGAVVVDNLNPSSSTTNTPPDNTTTHTPGHTTATAIANTPNEIIYSIQTMSTVDSIFMQWLENLSPCPYVWEKWISPNQKVCIEQILNITEENFPSIAETLGTCPIDSGTRIIVINQDSSHSHGADALLAENEPKHESNETATSPTGTARTVSLSGRFHMLLADWQSQREDRQVCLICPTRKYGTQKMPVILPTDIPPPSDHVLQQESNTNDIENNTEKNTNNTEKNTNITENTNNMENKENNEESTIVEVFHPAISEIYLLDSAYRSNEFLRLQKKSEIDRNITNENKENNKNKKNPIINKSKRAQQQRMEKEKLKNELINKEINDIKLNQIPDGYILMNCMTTTIKTIDFIETITNKPNLYIIGDDMRTNEEKEENLDDLDLGLPTLYDFIQLPQWFIKFSPCLTNIFIKDEVLLLIRQNPETKEILNIIEKKEYYKDINQLYQESRLSELSRPIDLREVDMNINGIIPMFFINLIKKIWYIAIPDEIKSHMFELTDEFILSYCFSYILKNDQNNNLFSSSINFCQIIEYSLILSLILKSAYKMSKINRYSYIIKNPDIPILKVETMEKNEIKMKNEKLENKNRLLASEQAWRLADPKAAEVRDKLEKERINEENEMKLAIEEMQLKEANRNKNNNTTAIGNTNSILQDKEKLNEIQKEINESLAVVEINYDSDLEAIENDENEILKLQKQANFNELLNQKEDEHTTQSIKLYTNERSQKIALTKSKKEQEKDIDNSNNSKAFDLESEGIEQLEKIRSELLVATMEVILEVIIEKEIYNISNIITKQLINECYDQIQSNKIILTKTEKLKHAKLQISRLKTEMKKSRRIYGKRMSCMT